MTWQFPSREQWLLVWEAAHAVYAEDMDPSDYAMCQALLWQAQSICQISQKECNEKE